MNESRNPVRQTRQIPGVTSTVAGRSDHLEAAIMSTSKSSHVKELEMPHRGVPMRHAQGTPVEVFWRGLRSDFVIVQIAELPAGYRGRKCPFCGSDKLSGSILKWPNGDPIVETADEIDPSILCGDCGWADDSIYSEFERSDLTARTE